MFPHIEMKQPLKRLPSSITTGAASIYLVTSLFNFYALPDIALFFCNQKKKQFI